MLDGTHSTAGSRAIPKFWGLHTFSSHSYCNSEPIFYSQTQTTLKESLVELCRLEEIYRKLNCSAAQEPKPLQQTLDKRSFCWAKPSEGFVDTSASSLSSKHGIHPPNQNQQHKRFAPGTQSGEKHTANEAVCWSPIYPGATSNTFRSYNRGVNLPALLQPQQQGDASCARSAAGPGLLLGQSFRLHFFGLGQTPSLWCTVDAPSTP